APRTDYGDRLIGHPRQGGFNLFLDALAMGLTLPARPALAVVFDDCGESAYPDRQELAIRYPTIGSIDPGFRHGLWSRILHQRPGAWAPAAAMTSGYPWQGQCWIGGRKSPLNPASPATPAPL